MQITKHAVAAIDYTLKNDAGDLIDTSSGQEPLSYVHGVGALVPGLEAELEGKSAGDKVDVRIAPEDGYGKRHEGMVQRVSRSLLPEEVEPRVGMQLQTQSEQGPLVLTVVDVQDEEITVDGNHPLAGVTLHFEVDVVSVRAATAEEIEHGHVHGPGGHAH